MHMSNRTGSDQQWAADLIENETYQGRISSVQRPEGHTVRAKIGEQIHVITSEKGKWFSMDHIVEWVRYLPPTV